MQASIYHTRHEGEVRGVGPLFPRICTATVGHYAAVMEHSGPGVVRGVTLLEINKTSVAVNSDGLEGYLLVWFSVCKRSVVFRFVSEVLAKFKSFQSQISNIRQWILDILNNV